jgi:hypothetical protein
MKGDTMYWMIWALVVCWIFPEIAEAQQPLAQRIAVVETGTVHLSFAARAGVCREGINGMRTVEQTEDWEDYCEPQPVRVALRLHDGRVTAIRSYVGGRWRAGSGATDLGTVPAKEAAGYFVSLAERGPTAGDPLLPATLADSAVIWPALLGIARKPSVSSEVRRAAIFWLGQAAGAKAAQSLDSIAGDQDGDRAIRKQAVFALSQRRDNEGVPALLRIARSNSDPEVRKTALFWLGQSEDPRALTLFEEILR